MKRSFLVLLILIVCEYSEAQLFFNTWDVINNTKYYRKNQVVHAIESVFRENGSLVINFTATLGKKEKEMPYHIVLAVDSVLPYYNKNINRDHFDLDSI